MEQPRMKATIISAGHFHTFHRMAPFIAKEMGFWKKEGLEDAWIIVTGEDVSTIAGLEKDSIQIGLDLRPSVVYRENSKGHEVYIVGSMLNTSFHIIIAAKGIKSVEDLKGKRIGMVERGGGIDITLFRRVLGKHGLSIDKDVTRVPGPTSHYPRVKPSLDKGDYDAVWVYDWWAEQAEKDGYRVLGSMKEEFPDGYSQRVIAANGRYIKEQSESLKAFFRAQLRAYRLLQDPKQLPEVLKLLKGHDWEKRRYWGWDYPLENELIENGVMFKMLAAEDGLPKGLEEGVMDEKAAGNIPESFQLDQVTRLTFMREAAEEIDKRYGKGRYQ